MQWTSAQRRLVILFLGMLSAVGAGYIYKKYGTCATPINLTCAKNCVEQYYESGCFDRELNHVIKKAHNYFESHDHQFSPKKTVIFDVDDTILSNYPDMKSILFGYVPKMFHEWVLEADAPVIPRVKQLYEYLIDHKYHVIFLTGRRHNEYDATIKNLALHGITTFDRLIVRPEHEESLTAQMYKSKHRAKLAAEGFEIVASIGDQTSDLAGDHSGLTIKIPNYTYVID